MIIPISLAESSVTSLSSITGSYGEYPDFQYLCIDRDSYIIDSHLDSGLEFYIGEGRLTDNLHIGRYCSIAHHVTFSTRGPHAYTSVTTSSSRLFPHTQELRKLSRKGTIILQNDVWIGMNTTIMPGNIIRNGAVVAAGSHVVTDIPPYAIYGGNPAKLIKYRFSPEIIRKLQAIRWWYWPEEKIRKNSAYFTEDVEDFCRKFYEPEQELAPAHVRKDTAGLETYLFFPWHKDNYSVLPQVIDHFAAHFQSQPDKRLLLMIEDTTDPEIRPLLALLEKAKEAFLTSSHILCQLDYETYTLDSAEHFFPQASYLITSRHPYMVRLTCLADRYGLSILHGTDIPIWAER